MTAGTVSVGISYSFFIAATGRLMSGIGAILLNVMMTEICGCRLVCGERNHHCYGDFRKRWPGVQVIA